MTNETKVYNRKLNSISLYFSPRELYAMWTAVCRISQDVPYTFALKSKLFNLITEDQRQEFNRKYE